MVGVSLGVLTANSRVAQAESLSNDSLIERVEALEKKLYATKPENIKNQRESVCDRLEVIEEKLGLD